MTTLSTYLKLSCGMLILQTSDKLSLTRHCSHTFLSSNHSGYIGCSYSLRWIRTFHTHHTLVQSIPGRICHSLVQPIWHDILRECCSCSTGSCLQVSCTVLVVLLSNNTVQFVNPAFLRFLCTANIKKTGKMLLSISKERKTIFFSGLTWILFKIFINSNTKNLPWSSCSRIRCRSTWTLLL